MIARRRTGRLVHIDFDVKQDESLVAMGNLGDWVNDAVSWKWSIVRRVLSQGMPVDVLRPFGQGREGTVWLAKS